MALVVFAGACGGGGEPSGGSAESPSPGGSSEGGTSQADRGKRLVEQRGCLSCHTTDGGRGVGPTFDGLAGSEVRLSDGRTVRADRDYLLRAILEPDADTVAGFPAGVMAGAMPAPLTEEEADAVVRYLLDR